MMKIMLYKFIPMLSLLVSLYVCMYVYNLPSHFLSRPPPPYTETLESLKKREVAFDFTHPPVCETETQLMDALHVLRKVHNSFYNDGNIYVIMMHIFIHHMYIILYIYIM